MNKYLVKLCPLGKFFFGGDMTFQIGNDEKSEHNSAYASYVLESNLFPQQTSLLGMMRYLFLCRNPQVFSLSKRKIINPAGEEVKAWIGAQSFMVTDKHECENDFGKIKSLGPCFLLKEDEAFLQLPKDYDYKVDFSKNTSILSSLNGHPLIVPVIEQYNPKSFREPQYVGLKSGKIESESAIFEKDIRIGINKNYQGKSDEKGFYKQISYRLKNDFSFAFLLETEIDLSDCQHEVVSLGADGSKFSLSVAQMDDIELRYPERILPKLTEGYARVVLLSDSLLDGSDWELACFSITGQVPFRYLKSTVETNDYNVLSGKVKRSEEKYYLYEKGSVFYFKGEKTAQQFVEQVEGKKEFHQIGYNYCI